MTPKGVGIMFTKDIIMTHTKKKCSRNQKMIKESACMDSSNLANYKTITYDKDGERELVYDFFKDEIFNIQTGEVIK